jgi:cytochrome c peroxidase
MWLALVLALVLATSLNTECVAQPTESRSKAAAFTHDSLLQRFDHDRDGELSQPERTALQTAFGGMAVPMLPNRVHQYSLKNQPAHIHLDALRALDNRDTKSPPNDHQTTLGRVLFFDTQLSRNDTISCASCHRQDRAFSDPRKLSVGFEGGKTGRNAMGIAYIRFSKVGGANPGFFWDERAATLEEQVLMPIQDKIEMGMELEALEQKLQELPYYQPLFEAAFDSPQVTADKVAVAIAEFMRSMTTFDSKFDRAANEARTMDYTVDYSVDFAGFSALENLGKSLFVGGVNGVGEIGCAHCHVPPSFGMPKSFNNGLDLKYSDEGLGARDLPSNDPFTPTNDGKFKASSLRNIALTGPFMHDGRFKTLEEVVEHYSRGVHSHRNLGVAVEDSAAETSGFHLTKAQKLAIVAFLNTLTDVELISDPKFSDPFVRLQE